MALYTSIVWNKYCPARISVIYRGRAIPVAWQVLEHNNSSVTYEVYRNLLEKLITLLPLHSRVVFLADRGFSDTKLMKDLKRLGWHWRIRIKDMFYVYRRVQCGCRVSAISPARGQARFWHHVYITAQRFGLVHLALSRPHAGNKYCLIFSDEPTDVKTFDEHDLRYDIQENFLDDKSSDFQLESSLIRSAEALSRLCFVLAIITLYAVSQGTEVGEQGKRRWVAPHRVRGKSYLKISWDWVKAAQSKGLDLITRLHLSGEPGPEPTISSRSQFMCHPQFRISVESFASHA